MLELREYNVLQVKLFKEFNITEIAINDIIEFRKICSLISVIRDFSNITEAEELARLIITRELNTYKN